MSYAISVSVGGCFPVQVRAKAIARNAIRSTLMLLIYVVTPKADVFMAVERHDAAIAARDNNENEIAKLKALQAAV